VKKRYVQEEMITIQKVPASTMSVGAGTFFVMRMVEEVICSRKSENTLPA